MRDIGLSLEHPEAQFSLLREDSSTQTMPEHLLAQPLELRQIGIDSISRFDTLSYMSTASKNEPRMTAAEYLVWERQQDTKHEFLDGEVFAMAGGTRRHSLIGTNLVGELRNHLKGGDCEAHGSDMQVYIKRTGLYTYPDASVVCPPIEGETEYVINNPVLIGEVLSSSTADYDRGTKFSHYRKIPSLTDYLVLYQDELYVEHRSRTEDRHWLLQDIRGEQPIKIQSLGITLSVSELYAKVEFETSE